MNKKIKKTLSSWFISYDVYTDIFQMFDKAIYKRNLNMLPEANYKHIKLIFSSENKQQPLLIEVKDGYKFFGGDANSMLKSDIINKLTIELESYAKSANA